VGTKLKIAFLMDKHDTVGQDCVAMCVNDILCQGAKPLFFLDYIATGKVQAEKIADIVKGIADGCLLAGCALVGGETAEMPDFYQNGEYDMAGFAVGVVDKSKIIDGSTIQEGDVVIGLPSSGLHSNGFSLVRKLYFDKLGLSVTDYIEELGMTLGEALITPTKIYTQACEAVSTDIEIKGILHITGGGFFENIPRIIPEGLGVEISLGTWEIPPIINHIQLSGNIEQDDMYATFNMGIGMMMITSEGESFKVISRLSRIGEKASVVGKIIQGSGVTLCQK
jgi:phosphoribosylformylglycinamidine cyclo-ligase